MIQIGIYHFDYLKISNWLNLVGFGFADVMVAVDSPITTCAERDVPEPNPHLMAVNLAHLCAYKVDHVAEVFAGDTPRGGSQPSAKTEFETKRQWKNQESMNVWEAVLILDLLLLPSSRD